MPASSSPDAGTPPRTLELADPPASALRVPTPVPLARDSTVSHWAPVRQAVGARAHAGGGPTVARLATRTPEGTQNLVLVLRRAVDDRGRLWLEVRLAAGTVGWVPRAALGGLHAVHTRLVVDRARREATLSRDGRELLRVPVGVGGQRTPTPAGQFYIRNRLTRYRSPEYGPVAFGTSARSRITDWPAGGYVGIHGTNRPDLLPGRVSHGCIRLRNADILRLERLMPVGTPLTIR